jgi:uncharacterized protein YbjQ (UPF0145 family)
MDPPARTAAWEAALERDTFPDFVRDRLQQAGERKLPWLATMTPIELLLAKRHGVRPIATVSGTCWYHYGYSWTEGHQAGWNAALERIRNEARACGANGVVDVRMRTIDGLGLSSSMDFTLVGTAVRFESLGPSRDPVIATVPALEFVRLLEMGIVPCGLAIGAEYEWLQWGVSSATDGSWSFQNQVLSQLSNFWEKIRRRAHAELRRDAARQGNGLLAHTHFGQLIKREGEDKQPPAYLGRHIVIGTVIDTPRNAPVPHDIRTVVDMRDDESPLKTWVGSRHMEYGSNEREGGI